MALTIILEDEHGTAVRTAKEEFDYNELEHVLVIMNNFQLFKYVDFYGDTVFNCLQMDDLIKDLNYLKTISKQQEVIKEMIELAEECKTTVHTYLKYYGD